jgi:predicted ATPase/class 3 adenylate cyclase
MSTLDADRVLLLSDIVDSTLWGQRLGEGAAAALWTQHDRLARDLLRDWRGREIDKSDGFLLLFDRVADALGYAAVYHAMLATLEPPLAARVGVHSAPVTLRENPPHDVQRGAKPLEVDGVAKPVAARIMALARPGQTLLSAAARAAVASEAALRFASHGHWQFKGVDQPVELFEALQPHALPEAPVDGDKGWRVVRHDDQWLPASDRPHSLPAERDRFIGRRASLRDLAERFERGARLVTLLGPGGTGKTRLAVRAGWIGRGEHPGGVWFCDVSSASDVAGIVHAMAQGLQLSLSGSDPIDEVGEALRGRARCLVIVDNFEQVARHAEATLGRWLERAPQARFIATTREVLGIVGEDVLALAPLPVDDGLALFAERAKAAGAAPWSASDEEALAPLVNLLDGLPLAIELAASRSRVLPPARLLPRMAERFKLLRSTHGRHDRQATLRATLDWSWDLLNDTERSALAQLSVFEGGCSIDAIEAVVDVSACDAGVWIVDVVQSLVQKSLVRRGAGDRFDLLRTVHDYAAARLDALPAAAGVPAREAAWRRHAAHFSALDEIAATQQRCIDSANLVSACRRMLALGDLATAAQVLVPAWAAVKLVGPFSTGVELADALLRAAPQDAALRTPALWVRGSARYLLGDAPNARTDLEAALAASPEGSTLRCRASCTLAEVESTFGDPARAAALFDDALALAQRLDDPARQCQALNGLGSLAVEQSRSADACELYTRGLAVAQARGDRRWEGGLLGNLGTLRHMLGDLQASRLDYDRALDCARATGDRHFEGNTQCNLGLLLLELGLHEQALPHFEAALDLARSLGHARLVGMVLCNLGLLNELEGRSAAALELHASAVDTAQRQGDKRAEGQFRIYLGRLLARSGRLDEARRCLQRCDALVPGDDALTAAMLLCARAETEHLGGDGSLARALLQQARAPFRVTQAEPASELGRELTRLEALLAEAVTRG